MITNKKDIKHLEFELNHIQEKLDEFSVDNLNDNIKAVWQQLKINKGHDDLKTMPIDTISTLEKGMPINVLTDYGFRTIYDIRNQSYADLMNIDGIGEKNAAPIDHAVSKIKESVYQQAKPRINPDHISVDDIKLLESIYRKWELSTTVESLRADVDDLHKKISSDMETAKRKKNVVGFLVQSKAEKEDIRAAFDRLNEDSRQKSLNYTREKLG